MADLLSYALTTVEDVKESMGIASGDTSYDNLIKRKINQATMMIESFCNLPLDHHFKEATYTQEVYNGNGTNRLRLKMWPVSAVSSFQYRLTTQNEDDWDDNETEDYFIDNNAGILNLLFDQSYTWGTFRVTYTAGYSTIPVDLAEACVMLASAMIENSSSGTAVKRKREGQREIEYFQAGGGAGGDNSLIESLGIDDMLARYINYALADR